MDNGLFAWETNAQFWDERMGNESNSFHRDLVRPHTEEFLDVKKGDLVLDIACGNGNFSKRLADNGARVVAFDYSPKVGVLFLLHIILASHIQIVIILHVAFITEKLLLGSQSCKTTITDRLKKYLMLLSAKDLLWMAFMRFHLKDNKPL